MRKVDTVLVLLLGCVLLVAAAVAGSSLAGAEPAQSRWVGETFGQARLIAGEVDGTVYAGVEIRMDKGWKTYWRIPGDAGVPPDLDWSQSGNLDLDHVRVLYPAPKRLADPIGYSLGYETAVVLPVMIRAKDASAPIDLRLKLMYGVCREICVPAEAALELKVNPAALKGASPAIAAALARVPRAPKPGAPEVTAVAIDAAGAKPRLVLEARFPGGTDGADAFIEAERGELLALPALPPEEVAPGLLRFIAPLAADAPQRLKGKPLTVTLTSAGGQSETVLRLP